MILIIMLLSVPLSAGAADARVNFVKEQLVASGVSSAQAERLFLDSRLARYPLKTVAYKQPDWTIIEQKLTSAALIKRGKDYLAAHRVAFDKAEQQFGVPREVLAGVIAIETDFGMNTGSYTVFNVLYSRMEEWPEATWKSQARELVALGKLCVASKRDCFEIRGSYAGAIGLVQFMPSSFAQYGVDGDGDGVIDLLKARDAVPSAAKFLKLHGWDKDQLKALAGYYGSTVGYPHIVLKFASLLKK